jgi:hypothetical protein
MSKPRGFGERLKDFFGIYSLRCKRCGARWQTSVWTESSWRYARCPRCYNMELSTWSEQYYLPPAITRWMLRTGATPYRCDRCRCNFASFRACKERFSWRKKQESQQERTA